MSRKLEEQRMGNVALRGLLGVFAMSAYSGILRIWGLEGYLIFNKGIWSLGACLLGWVSAGWFLRHWNENRRTCVISYVMAFGLVFTEILGTAMRLNANVPYGYLNLMRVLFLIFAAAVLAVPAESVFYAVGTCKVTLKRSPKASSEAAGRYDRWSPNRWFLLFWVVLFVGYLPCLLAFYPGLYCYDMIWQWEQYAGSDFSTHHPLLHTWLSGSVIELGKTLFGSYQKGILLHSLFQLLALSGSLAFGLRFLVKRQVRPAVLLGVGAFFLLFPFIPVMGISTTKDTIFGCLFFLVFVCICDMMAERRLYRGWRLAAFFVCSVLMCLFRNNAMYGLIVMAAVLFCVWLWKTWRRQNRQNRRGVSAMILLCVLCVVVSKGSFTLLEKGFYAKKGSVAEMLSVPMQQMARTYALHQEEYTEEEKAELLSFFDEYCVKGYLYYSVDLVKAGMDMDYFQDHKGDFLRLWLHLGKKFPGEYLASPLYNTFGIWYLGGDSSCYMEYEVSPPFDEEHVVVTESKLPWLQRYYSWFTDLNLQKYLPGLSILFYTSFYSWCVAWSAGVMFIRKRYGYLVLPLFVACYNFGLLFGPCMTVRYMLGSIFCVPVLLVMTFLTEDSENAVGSESA